MPPHCDSLDGPVVTAARRALDSDDVDVLLPFVPVDGEDEIRAVFDLVCKGRTQGSEAQQVADLFFFDTAVRVHRRGEGVAHTQAEAGAGVQAARAYTSAMLGSSFWSHRLWQIARQTPHH